MKNEEYKAKAHALVKKAKEKGLVKSYKDFCNTDAANDNKLSEEESSYYTHKNEEENH